MSPEDYCFAKKIEISTLQCLRIALHLSHTDSNIHHTKSIIYPVKQENPPFPVALAAKICEPAAPVCELAISSPYCS
jgi:hypothetical protein